MEPDRFSFERLEVFIEARKLVKQVYILQHKFPVEERYELGDQIRRSVTSVTSNIAEGSGRDSLKEKIHFIEISFGSLMEAFSQLLAAQDLGYLSESEVKEVRPQFIKVSKMLSGLRNAFKRKLC